MKKLNQSPDMKEFERAIAVEVTGDRYRIVQEGEAFRKCDERIDVGLPDIFDQMNAILTAKGWHDLSPWWRRTIGRVYLSGARNAVIRGGRRGGKSTAVCRVAVHEVINVPHVVPPGDIGYFAIISAERDQAKERLRTIAKILEALEVPHKALTEEIRVDGLNVGFKCFTASLSGVVSFTCIGALCDEEARWRDRDTGANPADEVLASLKPTMATQPLAKIWHVSSPWSTLDVHHKAIERGTTDDQIVFIAPTWEMNPTISEEATKILEPDEPTRLREYGAIPMAADSSKFFSAALIDLATQPQATNDIDAVYAGADFAFRKDASALAIVNRCGNVFVVSSDTDRVPSDVPLRVTDTIEEFADLAVESGADTLCADLHYVESVREVLEDYPVTLVEFPNQSDKINEAYVRVRVLLAQGRLDLSRASEKLIEQLKSTESKPSTNGLTISHPRGKGTHGDIVSALVAGIWSADIPEIRAATAGRRRYSRYQSTEGWAEYASDV